ncbi:nucleolar protein 14 [Suillus clintonianus]|uniref:nucleolar protein 14 n=1 Tax=Suillus clintonianus TaxID=1904413 RepID=UPI001B86B96F|nr:nucleolar protein 14 [Suillus clintonianus]KAG2149303.1 nucleolar protein 14 [Suillus clintonianus]
MAKGSQLSQLKSALSQAGISKTPQNGKKRKRSGSIDQDKIKKAAKLQEIHKKLNPFDVKVTKLKHDVGGRKIKGSKGQPAQSKQAGIEQREKTLLKEFQDRGRVGGIVDRRFGENDPSMSLEERMLERFTKERQRASKGTIFNLEGEEELTHYGQSLSNLDDFDDVGLPMDEDEDDDNGQMDRDIVGKAHFGGFGDKDEDETDHNPDRKKSKAEVMTELIAKSKEHKARRQLEKVQEESMRHQLDEDFDSLRSLLFAPGAQTTDNNAASLGSSGDLPAIPSTDIDEQMDYDRQVRELAFDQRAKPKDRTKTEDELALEEKENLEKAERQRRRRMLGDDGEDSDDGGRNHGKRKRERGGDDLEDDFAGDESLGGIGLGLGGINGQAVAEDESEEEEDDDEGVDGDEESDNDDENSEAEDGSEPSFGSEAGSASGGEFDEITTSQKSAKLKPPSVRHELPFTFPCPESHEEFLEIIEEIDHTDVPTVIQRIRTLHHPSLSPENKVKLQNLTSVLVDHVLYITSPPAPQFTLLNSIVPHLFALCRSYPIESAGIFVEKLSLMHKNLERGLSRGALELGARTWPGPAELSLLRTIGVIWSSSDMSHPIISPARLLMGAYLGLCRVRSLTDITSGLFLSSLFLQYEELSKRLVPEAVNFSINAVLHLAPSSLKNVASIPGSFPSPDFRSDLCAPLTIDVKKSKHLDFHTPNLHRLLTDVHYEEQDKLDLLGLAFRLLDRFSEMYKSLAGFIELYQPLLDILTKLNIAKLSEGVRTQASSLQDKLTRLLKFARQARRPLLLQAHKPIPIPTYIPKFESRSSSYLRRQDPDHERNEASKLRYQLKQEKKGAIRELRKDAKFLAAVEHKQQAEKDRAYKNHMNKAFSSLEGERAEQKAMDREKEKEKPRSGRK